MQCNVERSLKLTYQVCSTFGLSITLLAGGLLVQAAEPSPQSGTVNVASSPEQTSETCDDDFAKAENLSLSYLRKSSEIIALLTIIKQKASLNCLVFQKVTEDGIVLYGSDDEKNKLKQIVALLDLPRPGINMELWGIQLSSPDAKWMAEAMTEINEEIENQRQFLQASYDQIQDLAKALTIEPEFKKAMDAIGYGYILDKDPTHPLSLTDIFLRILATEPRGKVAEMANNFNDWLKNDYCKKNEDICKYQLKNKPIIPYRRFLEGRGLTYKNNKWQVDTTKEEKHTKGRFSKKVAVLDFAIQYRLSQEDKNFNGQKLQASADLFNDVLQDTIKEINADVQELFVNPTLNRIREIADNKNVSYAQVGKISVATLNGFETEVSAKSVSAFDATPQIKLSKLLQDAGSISASLNKLIPVSGAASSVTNPASSIVGLVGALGEQDTVWSGLTAGVSLKMTPNVLRDTNSAELVFTLETGPSNPEAAVSDGSTSSVSRVNQHKVKSNIYLKTMDLFTFSTFDNQSTKAGERWYIPVIGQAWRGLFSGLPVVGNLFSFVKDPQNVYHQSILLANTLIIPTAMEIANLYDRDDADSILGTPCPIFDKEKKSETTRNLSKEIKDLEKKIKILEKDVANNSKKDKANELADKKKKLAVKKKEMTEKSDNLETMRENCHKDLKVQLDSYKNSKKNGLPEFQYLSPDAPKGGDKKTNTL